MTPEPPRNHFGTTLRNRFRRLRNHRNHLKRFPHVSGGSLPVPKWFRSSVPNLRIKEHVETCAHVHVMHAHVMTCVMGGSK